MAVCLMASSDAAAYKIQKSVFGSGSAQTSNANFIIRGTLGQPAVGGTANASNMACLGYWCIGATPVVSVPGPDPDPDPTIDLPHTLSFSAPRPNPARSTVNFDLALPTDARVRLVIYDIAGRAISEAPVSQMPAGYHTLRWDGRSQGVGPGIYFARLDVDGQTVGTKRMVLVR